MAKNKNARSFPGKNLRYCSLKKSYTILLYTKKIIFQNLIFKIIIQLYI